jgi:hypothetical protein
MRAYKFTIAAASGGDGDDWVEEPEFPALLVNLFYFTKLWAVFTKMDADGDRRVTFAEFQRNLGALGVTLSQAEARAEFDTMDINGGGMVLFDGARRAGRHSGRRAVSS